ncbi:MAG: hypothetical protein LBF40_11245 [Deltaproteobacteria bacterium]|jgi:hypothetical protein|nr:hypothetical protein [Deltaproteobacteria bacterium]
MKPLRLATAQLLLPALLFLLAAAAQAQTQPPAPSQPQTQSGDPGAQGQVSDTPAGREFVHLSMLGTFSAGFVLETYGFIGSLADLLHHGVYEPETVRSMLGETKIFLQRSLENLRVYQDRTVTVSPRDLQFINGIAEITAYLISEADSLSAYAESFDKKDYDSYKDARAKAWSGIKLHLGIK